MLQFGRFFGRGKVRPVYRSKKNEQADALGGSGIRPCPSGLGRLGAGSN